MIIAIVIHPVRHCFNSGGGDPHVKSSPARSTNSPLNHFGSVSKKSTLILTQYFNLSTTKKDFHSQWFRGPEPEPDADLHKWRWAHLHTLGLSIPQSHLQPLMTTRKYSWVVLSFWPRYQHFYSVCQICLRILLCNLYCPRSNSFMDSCNNWLQRASCCMSTRVLHLWQQLSYRRKLHILQPAERPSCEVYAVAHWSSQ